MKGIWKLLTVVICVIVTGNIFIWFVLHDTPAYTISFVIVFDVICILICTLLMVFVDDEKYYEDPKVKM